MKRPPNLDAWLRKPGQRRIATAIRWQDAIGTSNYLDWPKDRRRSLRRYFQKIWKNRKLKLVDPPPNELASVLLDNDDPRRTVLRGIHALSLFLAYVAHSLVLELSRPKRVDWSVRGYGKESLRALFDGTWMFRSSVDPSGTATYEVNFSKIGLGVPAPPDLLFAFIRPYIQSTRLKTIDSLISWCRDYLKHFFGNFAIADMEEYWNYRGAPPVSRVIEGTSRKSKVTDPEELPRNWTAGCHGTAALLHAVLRSVNIPVRRVELTCDNLEHSLVHFMVDQRYLSHADDPYDPCWKHLRMPGKFLLLKPKQFKNRFGGHVPDRLKCKNKGRRPYELEVKHLSHYLLSLHCRERHKFRKPEFTDVYKYLSGASGKKVKFSIDELKDAGLWDRMNTEIDIRGGCEEIRLV